MKKVQLLLVLFATALIAGSCHEEFFNSGCNVKGSGNFTVKSRELYNFDIVTAKISGDIYVRQDSTESFKIETDDNIQDYITTVIQGGNLVIDSDKSLCPQKLDIYIGMTDIKAFNIEGSNDITGMTPVNCPELSFDVSGSGDINFRNVTTGNININIDGSGDVLLTGKGTNSNISINGSGDIDMDEMEVNSSVVVINGSGDVRVNVRQKLTVTISGSGDIYYKGNPTDINTNISGSGSLIKVN